MVITIMSQLSNFLLVSVAEQTIFELIPVFSRDVAGPIIFALKFKFKFYCATSTHKI